MKTSQISDISERLRELPPQRLKEVMDFVDFLREKERRRKAFVHRVLEAEKGPFVDCKSVEEVMRAIENGEDD